MAQPPYKPCALNPKPDERELHAERCDLKPPRAELITADIEQGLRIANALWFIVNGAVRYPLARIAEE